MTYQVKEIFYTLQGEGRWAGRPAVFCRFSACNLWTGRERDRSRAVCRFCDTDFVGTNGPGGGKFKKSADLAAAVESRWPVGTEGEPMVVFTGGEPLIQLDGPLIAAMQARGFYVAVETNGTLPAPEGIDWICVSPKAGAPLALTAGDELKLVYPQAENHPDDFIHLDFASWRLQPLDDPNLAENTRLATLYCLQNPRWQLSLQTHKIVGIA
ncbi:7-carboxy-7-deazaguanine synthase [Propioniciclava sp. MC1683]|uniref:7-carboxy-7-deazaguanine synthase n=1 Tax=Propioniciclava sp. MC1683 TaxID=2760309 RepID=UPI001600A81A|nr:7-carboxy-7-deazaguanine synthase [Propioniciclava sp. MC1683]MBB1501862.1 7-carboxy-7-deazaguanine synthase [Propioniciclava sp. MC1683]